MCVLCYELVSEDHWTDATSVADARDARGRARHRRTRVLSAVLAAYGLTVSDPGSGRHRVIADRKGAAEVAAGLPEVWQAAERLSRREIDVLDRDLLAALEGTGPA